MWILAACGGLVAGAGAYWLLVLRYVALGDSLAAGVGSFTFTGYVRRFAWALMLRLKRVILTTNLGRFGWTSAQLLEALRTDGRFQRAVRGARLITVDIGGNDLLHCNYQADCLQEALANFRENWHAILMAIRDLNPAATLIVLTLYDPVPEGDVRRPAIDAVIRSLNETIGDLELCRQCNVAATVPIYEAFVGHECEFTWFCRIGDIHPTDRGHAAMAEALLNVWQEKLGTKAKAK